ncbi:DMT family transporter [Hoeflea sp. TYP-13]|uniref:DMT family transporter n=1 Tax=Hoeflea sp. TYP-13 TaxID=3230023 RepID=UPI0034C667F4
MQYEAAALGAALCWAIAGMISSAPAKHLGAIAFNRTRMVIVLVILGGYAFATGSWLSIGGPEAELLIISGFIGIFVGDTALFLTLNRMGPRRTAILFATNAPMSVVLGWMVLGEALSFAALAGIAITIAGVVLSIVFGKRRAQLHHWESITGPLWAGITLGLIAALAQSVGSIIARPVMETGVDPVAASALRVAVAALGLTALMRLPYEQFHQRGELTKRVTGRIALSGMLGMGLGMTLLLFALEGGEVGIISTLSATSPALMLPLLWATTGERPAFGAWIGAALVVGGTALIFMN